MCVGFYSLTHPDYALILCANRDEYLDRPTTPAARHSFGQFVDDENTTGVILSGRDRLAGGTWLGMHRSGRVALLTNITEPASKYATSRGDLAARYLTSSTPLSEHTTGLTAQENWKPYAGFNMLLLEPVTEDQGTVRYEGQYASNSGGGGVITSRPLRDDERRCGGITNGIESLDGEKWPKLVEGKAQLEKVLQDKGRDVDEEALINRLAEILHTRASKPPKAREDLRNTIQVEPFMGATGLYGTRLATFVLVRKTGDVTFVERDVWQSSLSKNGDTPVLGTPATDRVFKFRIPVERK